MIILDIKRHRVNLYPIGRAKGALNSHRKPLFNGTFRLTEEKNTPKAIDFNIIKSSIAARREITELFDILNRQNIYLTGRNEMLEELNRFIASVKNEYLNRLLKMFFVDDAEFIKRFSEASAAKSVHHGFIGGLLEHTLSVTNLCDFFASRYPVLNRDLLISAALLHDIGKVKEISAFPINDYTDEGNLLGHIVMGSEMVSEKAASIEGFPIVLLNELKHCILAHHGELEFGSPKKPSLVEALALHFADNIDAKMETFTEIFEGTEEKGWLGFNRMLDNNIRATKGE